MLRTSLTKSALYWLPLLTLSLTGCGLTQSVTEGTKSAFTSVFYKKINVLHLDFTAREALNTDAHEHASLSQSVVIRIYQLKDRKTFDSALYEQLLKDDEAVLQGDFLASRDLVVKPGGDASLTMPMNADAKFIAVVGLFRNPDREKNAWKWVLEREELEPDLPRVFEAGSNSLRLISDKET